MSDTPETDAARLNISCDDSSCGIYCNTEDGSEYTGEVCRADRMADIERQRNEARVLLASEKSTRNAIIAKGIETERQLAEAREENARLREVLANATCLILAVGEPKETAGCQHGWYEARTMVLQQVDKLTP